MAYDKMIFFDDCTYSDNCVARPRLWPCFGLGSGGILALHLWLADNIVPNIL